MKSTSSSVGSRPQTGDTLRESRWDSFVGRHPTPHFLQTSGWGKLKSQFGWRNHLVVLEGPDGNLIAGAQCLSTSRYGLTIGYVPRGPLVDWQDVGLVREFKSRLLETARNLGWHFVMIEPDLEDLPANRELLLNLGLQPSQLSIQPRSTIRVDLTVTEDELLAGMKSKWRYNTRKAYRSGVRIRMGTAEDVGLFQFLMEETGRRQGFDTHSLAYHQTALDSMGSSHLKMFLAEVAGDTVAAIIVAHVGKGAWYPWGASSSRQRKTMPNFALHHAAMLWAKSQGAIYYDLWGIPNPLGELALQERLYGASKAWPKSLPIALERLPSKDLWSVYRLKQGFGGQIIHLVGAWDLPVQPFAYRLYVLGAIAQDRLGQLQASRGAQLPTSQVKPRGNGDFEGSLEWRTETTGEGWDATVGSHGEPHFMQSWAWGEQSAQRGWKTMRKRLVLDTGEKAGSAQLLIREICPALPLRMAHIPGGPILDWEDSSRAFLFLEQLEGMLRQEKVALMWIAPPLCRDRAAGLTVLARLEESGWQFCKSSWLQPDRIVTSLSNPSSGAQAPANGLVTGLDLGCEQKSGVIRYGSATDFDRLFKHSSPSCRGALNSAEIQFCLNVLANPMKNGQEDVNRPHSVLIFAEGPHEKIVGAALAVAWRGKTWYFNVPFSQEKPPTWAVDGLRRQAATWAIAQGCTCLDWGPAHSDTALRQRLDGVSGMETCFLRPYIGTWGRLLWPLPNRVSPSVQRFLEGAIRPVPPISASLPV